MNWLNSASRSRPVRDEAARVAASWSLGWITIGGKGAVIPEIETCIVYLLYNFIDNWIGVTSRRGYLMGRRLVKVKHRL